MRREICSIAWAEQRGRYLSNMSPVEPTNREVSPRRATDGRGGGGRRGRGGGAVTESRVAAADMLADLRSGMLLDAAFDKRTGALDARDRRWVQELVWGTLRRRGWIDAVISLRTKGGIARLDADVADLLRLGTYQLVAMRSVPAYAAIAQMVELTKQRHGMGASGLVNAVMRRIDRERDHLEPPVPSDTLDALAQQYSHPRWIVARWMERWSREDVEQLLAANNMEAPIVARPWRVTREELAAELEGAGVDTTSVPLVEDSLQLQPGVSLLELGAFRQGRMFVQDPAATLVTRFAHFTPGTVVADLCAAPGGKALELSRHAQRVIASDRNTTRVERMLLGFGRLDADNVELLVADARTSPIAPVDAVLIDVPCTGTGTFRRHPDARWRLRISDIAVMGALQREIMRGAAECVKPGGLFVYSTCSLEPEENDEMVDAFLAANPDFVEEAPPADAVPDMVRDGARLRVLPQVHGVDGAFAARMRRVG